MYFEQPNYEPLHFSFSVMSNSHPQLARSSSLRCRVSRRISRHSLSQRATHPDLDLASAQDWQSAGPQLCYLGADTVQTPDPSVDTRHTRLTGKQGF